MKRLLLALVLGGCSILPKAEPVEFRYFSPEVAETAHATRPRTEPITLHLGRVTSSANLRTRIVHRDSTWELGSYETLRWTENPESFVRRSLAHTLFEQRGFQESSHHTAPSLDVEVVEFEEVRKPGGARAGRVQLRWQLKDERTTLGNSEVVVERDASKDDIEAVVAAISSAMTDATSQVATAVEGTLSPH